MIRGAHASQSSLASRFLHWQQDHRRQLVESLTKIAAQPLASLLTTLVIGLALALPAILMSLLYDAHSLLDAAQHQSFISVYLKEAPPVAQLRMSLQALPGIERIDIKEAAESLQEFEALTGAQQTLSLLGRNPLPTVITLYPAHQGTEASSALAQAVQQLWPQADIEVDLPWIKRLDSFLEIMRRLFMVLFSGMSAAVLLVISNTIRLAVESRRDEIILLKLLGATQRMVRRPFLYTGFWYGFLGGTFSGLLVSASLHWLNVPIHQLAQLYNTTFQLQVPGLRLTLFLALMSASFGVLGAYLALYRHLRALDPS